MGFGYGSENRWHDQYFARELEVTGTAVTTEALAVGKHHGSLCVVLAAAEDEVEASGVALSIMEGDEPDGDFTAKADGPVVTLAEGTFSAGDIMVKMVLPDCKDFVKMQLAGGLSGKVDVCLGYLAR